MSAAGAYTHHAGNALAMLCTAPAALGRTGRARQATGEWDTASCASTKAVVCCKPPPDDFFDCGQNVQDESTEWCASFQTPMAVPTPAHAEAFKHEERAPAGLRLAAAAAARQ